MGTVGYSIGAYTLRLDDIKKRVVSCGIGTSAVFAIACLVILVWTVQSQNERNTGLLRAIKSGNSERAIELLNQGADANSSDQTGRSPFSETVELLTGNFHARRPEAHEPTALML